MIRLTRLNNRPLVVNSELIKYIENAPDTVITLTTGEKIVVLETVEEVMTKIFEYRQRLRRLLMADSSFDELGEPLEDAEIPNELETPVGPASGPAPANAGPAVGGTGARPGVESPGDEK
jgi:flagellar protein FlbD